MPTVLTTNKTINHTLSFRCAARQRAKPLNIRSNIKAAAIATAKLVLIEIVFMPVIYHKLTA